MCPDINIQNSPSVREIVFPCRSGGPTRQGDPHCWESPGVVEILPADAPGISNKRSPRERTRKLQTRRKQWGISRLCQSGPQWEQELPGGVGGQEEGGRKKQANSRHRHPQAGFGLETLRFSLCPNHCNLLTFPQFMPPASTSPTQPSSSENAITGSPLRAISPRSSTDWK